MTSDRGSPALEELAGDMRARHDVGDYSGALEAAERLLALDPDHDAAQRCAKKCRTVLSEMYAGRLGSLDRAPEVRMSSSEIPWIGIDHRAGFVLSLVDGRATLEEIVDMSGLPRFEALRLLLTLLDERAIALREPER